MKNNDMDFNKKLPNILFWGVCFILFLPIIILPPTFQPSDWTRVILFKIILTILVSFVIFRFFYKKDVFISLPKWKISTYLPFLFLAGFFIILIIATIFSQDIIFSFFGSPVRVGGLLNLFFYFIFAIFLALFINENTWGKLFNLLFIVGILASLLAIIQYFSFLGNIFISWGAGGPPSFLGNSTFLAIYMLFLSFLSFTLFTQEKEKKKKIYYGGLFCLFLFTIFITGSRATYLGILIGFLYFFLFYPKKLKKLKITVISILSIIVLIIILFNLFPQLSEKNNILKTITNRLSIKTVAVDLAGTRFATWRITLESIKEKPLLGWGPENFYIGFEKYYDPTLSNLERLWWDRPHNIFLNIAADSGIISLLFYILFWIFLLWQLQQFKRAKGDNKNTYLAHGIQAIFIGYLVALFFNFDSFSTYLISFFFIGYTFYLISEKEEKIIINPPQKSIIGKKFFIIFSIFIISFIFFWNIKPLYQNEAIIHAEKLTDAKKCKQSIPIIESVYQNSGILKAYAGLRYSTFLKQCAPLQPEKEIEYATKGLEALKTSSIIQPKFTRTWLFMGGFVNVLAAKESNVENKNKLLSEARDYFKKALALSPNRQEIYLEIEKNYLLENDYQTMETVAKNCIAIDDSQGECYWYLGIAEIFLGDQENGKKHIQESLDKPHSNTPAYLQLGVAYISQKNYKDAVWAYDMLVGVYPNNASYHATLAFLLREIGDYERANKEAIKVFKLQPENKEIIQFIQLLLGQRPNDPNLHVSLAFIYRESGEEEKSHQELLIVKSLYLQLIAQDYEKSASHLGLAKVYKELGEYEKSFQEALIALKLRSAFKVEVESLIQTELPSIYWDKYNQGRDPSTGLYKF